SPVGKLISAVEPSGKTRGSVVRPRAVRSGGTNPHGGPESTGGADREAAGVGDGGGDGSGGSDRPPPRVTVTTAAMTRAAVPTQPIHGLGLPAGSLPS